MTMDDRIPGTRARMRALVAAAMSAFAAGCAAPPPAATNATSAATMGTAGTRYTYVLLGEEGRPVARAITAAAQCPSIDLDGRVQPMDARMPAATITARISRFDPTASKPAAFPVLTCEKAIPAGTMRAAIDGRTLPLPKADPKRIAVIGDTGCRLQRAGNIYQDCNDPARWPFKAIAAAIAADPPDLIVHVGDYHYREDPCPAGNAQCAGSPWGYGWDTWEADFFAPAAALLAAAPWVVVRGNHETCDRGGQGWWRFMDTRPPQPRQDCNNAADDAIGSYSEPYAVPLGAAAGGTQLIVFDSSLVGLDALKPDDPMYRNYHAQFTKAFALAARSPRNLFLDHHPVLGFAPNPGKPASPWPGNAGLQSVLATLAPAALFPPEVQATIAGHNHLFEALSFSTPHPAQVIVGNSGDWVDDAFPVPFPTALMPAPGAKLDMITSTNRFGYMTMEPDGARWKMTVRDVRGVPMLGCMLTGNRIDCSALALP
jgi:hypothetical protein